MRTDSNHPSQATDTEALPPIEPPSQVPPPRTLREAAAFDPELLDHNVRRLGAYGALLVATLLYGLGAIVIMKHMALFGWDCTDVVHAAGDARSVNSCSKQFALVREDWHSFVTAMVALFSVPTVLVIAVLRAVTARKDPSADSAYNVVAEKLVLAVEKLFSK